MDTAERTNVLCLDFDGRTIETEAVAAAVERAGGQVSTRAEPATSIGSAAAGETRWSWADCAVLVVDDASAADGLDVLEALSTSVPALPVVVALGDGVDATAFLDAGATDCVRWTDDPGTSAVLSRRIDRAIADAPADDPSAAELERYRTVVESMHDPVYLLDGEGRVVLVNDAMVERLEYTREDYEGSFIGEFMDEAEYEAALETVRELLRTGREQATVEHEILLADGTTREGEADVTVLTEAGEHVGTVGVIRDVTDRTRRIRELARYETIVETAPIGLLVVDEEGTITWHNEEFTDDLGIEDRELVGTNFLQLADEGFFPGYKADHNVERVKHLLDPETDDSLSFEQEWFDVDGEPGITEVNMRLLPLEDGEYVGSVFAFRNVTDRIANQRELERQNDRLEDFASFVSHDLRNPLNVADGYVDLLRDRYDDEHLEEVAWAHDRIAELIDDLLALTREGAAIADPEPFPVAEVVTEAWNAVDTDGARLDLSVDPDVRVGGDPGRVKNLFENCFRNAVEHGSTSHSEAQSASEDTVEHGRAGADGALSVRVAVVDDAEDGSRDAGTAEDGVQPAGQGGFVVEDDGRGLPDGDVFDAGYSTAEDGTGLGLAIVREIVEAHGWEIAAGESDDGGARFEVTGVTIERA